MTTEDIVELAVNNHVVCEVYNALHSIVLSSISYLRDKNVELSTERELVKKFADANKLDVIKTILNEESVKEAFIAGYQHGWNDENSDCFLDEQRFEEWNN